MRREGWRGLRAEGSGLRAIVIIIIIIIMIIIIIIIVMRPEA